MEIVMEFQSLLSQGISLLEEAQYITEGNWEYFGFNPFLVRASVYCRRCCCPSRCTGWTFQSLLSQGISLLR